MLIVLLFLLGPLCQASVIEVINDSPNPGWFNWALGVQLQPGRNPAANT
jgi:hypothetical protein